VLSSLLSWSARDHRATGSVLDFLRCLHHSNIPPISDRYTAFIPATKISILPSKSVYQLGDLITVDCCPDRSKLAFIKEEQGALVKGQDEPVATLAAAVSTGAARSSRATRGGKIETVTVGKRDYGLGTGDWGRTERVAVNVHQTMPSR